MPELPEVETVKNGISPYLNGQKITNVFTSGKKMRYMIDEKALNPLIDSCVIQIDRRGKHLIITLTTKTGSMQFLIIHLGMSGTIQVKDLKHKPQKHDHFILTTTTNSIVFNDPRRFGYVIHTQSNPYQHPCLLKHGVEPLTRTFDGKYLYQYTQKTTRTIKQVIMDNHIVVGVGNIYASESLYLAKLHPLSQANQIPFECIDKLVTSIKTILSDAIRQGGTTLKDYRNSDGKPGYFSQDLKVYSRQKQQCDCGAEIISQVIAQRNTFFCIQCQQKY